jgi:hypothetical protein
MKHRFLFFFVFISVISGCMPGRNTHYITVTVFKDYHKKKIAEKKIPIHENENVLQVMADNFNIKTQYHGAVFNSIEGLETNEEEKVGWFYTINGKDPTTSPREILVHAGDQIDFDFHPYFSQN